MASAPQHGDYETIPSYGRDGLKPAASPVDYFRIGQSQSTAGLKLLVLAIDDDRQCLALLSAALKRPEIEFVIATSQEEGFEIVRRRRPQVVLLDMTIPGWPGTRAMERILEADSAINVILMTSRYSADGALEAFQKGACDYVSKPLPLERLRERVARLVSEVQRRHRARQLDEQLLQACRFEGMIGRSPLMLDVFARIARVAPHFRSVLISGAAGTGKELTAKAIHRLSPVASGPFVVYKCLAKSEEDAVQSELFGHVLGAFPGATCDKAGVFEAANGGTLFLDEIGKLRVKIQAKLLRAIQRQEIQRLGSSTSRGINVRVIAATSGNPRTMVREKAFREDLYSRLSMAEIKLPSLLERREDVPLLLRYFVEHFSRSFGKRIEGLTRRAETLLARYAWPENVRELENAIGHACMLVTESGRIDVRELPESFHGNPSWTAPQVELVSVDEIQRSHARRVLDHLEGDKRKTASVLGVSRATLYRLLAPAKAVTYNALR